MRFEYNTTTAPLGVDRRVPMPRPPMGDGWQLLTENVDGAQVVWTWKRINNSVESNRRQLHD